jgi:hypothetical protein
MQIYLMQFSSEKLLFFLILGICFDSLGYNGVFKIFLLLFPLNLRQSILFIMIFEVNVFLVLHPLQPVEVPLLFK